MINSVHVHFIGIGGIGMSGIAEILLSLGHNVSGSDLSRSDRVIELEKRGAKIYQGHCETNIENASIVVYSSAVNYQNPEMKKAEELGLPILKRAEMLAELMRLKKGIAIAGTHGKTTTTSMLATILKESDYRPTYVIGGVVNNFDKNADLGEGEYLIAEADESDGTFLLLNPIYSLVTNIDYDHLDFYETEENVESAFVNFMNKIPFYGSCSVNIEDEKIKKVLEKVKKPIVTFGLESGDYQAKNIKSENLVTTFDLYFRGEKKSEISFNMIGKYNVLNALGAISIAHQLGVDFSLITNGLSKFRGVGRRMNILKNISDKILIEDYAHHPTEIKCVIDAVKENIKDKKIIVFFEPHRYSRTKDCWEDFISCFEEIDDLFLLPIYPASEMPIKDITSERLLSDINSKFSKTFNLLSDYNEFEKQLNIQYQNGSIILCLGAGKIGLKTIEYSKELND